MNNLEIRSLMWQSVMTIDYCRKALIENEGEFIKALVRKGMKEHEAKKAFREEIEQNVKQMYTIGKEMGKMQSP